MKPLQIKLELNQHFHAKPQIGDIMDRIKISVSLLVLFLTIANTNCHRPEECFLIEPSIQGQVQTISIKNTIGVITLNKKSLASNSKQVIQFFNKDGSLWHEFSFYDDAEKRKPARPNVDFRPLSFHIDYFILALKCVSADKSRFEVVVNEATGLTKFLEKSAHTVELETWEEHILHLFAVGFNRSKNPLLAVPANNGRLIQVPKDAVFYPIKIRDNWLRVRWDMPDEGKETGYGWIKWKENNGLIIDFFYFA